VHMGEGASRTRDARGTCTAVDEGAGNAWTRACADRGNGEASDG